MTIYGGPDIITDGLVSYFDFANKKCYSGSGTSATDLSGYNNTALLENSPTFDSSNYGNLSLNGTNNRVAITPVSNLIRNYDSTTCLTIKLPLYSGSQRCIMSYRGSGGGGNLYIGKQSNGIFTYYDQISTPALTAGSLTSNRINYVCIICNATSSSLSMYINGVLITSLSRTGFISSYASSAIYLGYDNGGTNEYMTGNFYNFQHYNKTLTQSEILQNYNAIKGRFGL